MLLKLPVTVVTPPALETAVITGKFSKSLGPVCPAELFSVTPLPPRSMPNPVLEKIELSRISLPVPAVASTSTPMPLE